MPCYFEAPLQIGGYGVDIKVTSIRVTSIHLVNNLQTDSLYLNMVTEIAV